MGTCIAVTANGRGITVSRAAHVATSITKTANDQIKWKRGIVATKTFSKQLGELLVSISVSDDLDDYGEVYRNSEEIIKLVEKLQRTTFNKGEWTDVNTKPGQNGILPDDRGDVRDEPAGTPTDMGSDG